MEAKGNNPASLLRVQPLVSQSSYLSKYHDLCHEEAPAKPFEKLLREVQGYDSLLKKFKMGNLAPKDERILLTGLQGLENRFLFWSYLTLLVTSRRFIMLIKLSWGKSAILINMPSRVSVLMRG